MFLVKHTPITSSKNHFLECGQNTSCIEIKQTKLTYFTVCVFRQPFIINHIKLFNISFKYIVHRLLQVCLIVFIYSVYICLIKKIILDELILFLKYIFHKFVFIYSIYFLMKNHIKLIYIYFKYTLHRLTSIFFYIVFI